MKKTIIGGLLSLIICVTTQAQISKVNNKVYTNCIYREYDKNYELTLKAQDIGIKWDNVYGSKEELNKIVEFKFPKKTYKVSTPYSFKEVNDRGNDMYDGKVKDESGKIYETDIIAIKDSNYLIIIIYETGDRYFVGNLALNEFK